MRIRTQLAVTLSGMVAVSFFVAAIGATLASRQVVTNVLSAHHERQTQMLAALTETALSLHAEPILLRYLQLLKMLPGVTYAYIVDKEGRIILHSEPSAMGQRQELWQASPFGQASVEHETPIQIGPEMAATARIGFAKQFIQGLSSQASTGVLPPLVLFGITGILFSLLIGIGLAFHLSRPIHQLLAGARELGRGNLSVEVPVMSSNEMGQLSRQFNEMAKQLKQLDALKAEFLSIVSHDLRSPLGAVVAYSDHLLSEEPGPLTPTQRNSLETVRDQCQRLSHMVSNFLDMARIESGRMEIAHQPVALGPVIEETRQLFAFIARQKSVTLDVSVPPDVPSVLGDRETIRQVLTNLLSNALKFTKAGGTVRIEAHPTPEDGMVEVWVRDTGSGIPAGDLPRIFERFNPLASAAATPLRGTGLGLAISKAFVDALGGKIWLESVPGQGTTAYVRFPQVPPFAAVRPRPPSGAGASA